MTRNIMAGNATPVAVSAIEDGVVLSVEVIGESTAIVEARQNSGTPAYVIGSLNTREDQ